MITREQLPEVIGHAAYDRTHKKLGEIGQVYLDDETGEPEWITVRTGLFGTKETFVPLQPAELQGDEVVVPFQQEQIKEAPKVDTETGGRLPPEEEERLYEYYGMSYRPYPEVETEEPVVETPVAEAPIAEAPIAEAPAPATGRPTDEAMTRAEERLRVGKERRAAGRARLRKYVVTDYEQHTVPVRREEVRVEREPITDENRERAMAGPEISEAEHEVILEEERPVVAKETVPVERVRLEKEEVIEEETVGGEVRKERIESEGVEPEGGIEER
jgi:uncharacterized protein (TIGR02271 family)